MEISNKLLKQKIEKLKKESLFMHASWEEFSSKPTEIGAQYLWLKYTLLKEDVPDNVMEMMIEIIIYKIQSYEDNHTSYGALSKKETKKPVFKLLDLAINNPDDFWEILYAPDSNIRVSIRVSQFDEALLEKTRLEFPLKRKLKPGELYTFFGKQLGMKEEEEEEEEGLDIGERVELDIGERMRYRYRTYKRNKKAEELLFE